MSESLLNEDGIAALRSIQARREEEIKALVLEAVGRRALGSNLALVGGNSVGNAWAECKAAYDDTPFRNAHHDVIVERAKKLARRAGQTPDMMVSTEPPVPCRLEGFALWFFNEARCIPVWRLFEPLAIVQIKEELAEQGK